MSKRFNHLETPEGATPSPTAKGSPFRRKLEKLVGQRPLAFLRGFRRKVELPGREREPDATAPVPPAAVEREEPTLEVERPEPIRRHPDVPRRDLTKTKNELGRMAADLDRVTRDDAALAPRAPRPQTTLDREAYEEALRAQRPSVGGALLKIAGGLVMLFVGVLVIVPELAGLLPSRLTGPALVLALIVSIVFGVSGRRRY